MTLEYSRQIFKTCSNTKLSLKSVLWGQSCSVRTDGQICGQSDGYAEADSRSLSCSTVPTAEVGRAAARDVTFTAVTD